MTPRTRKAGHSVSLYEKNFFCVLIICLLTNVLATTIGWFNSVDVKGWWPIGLAVYFSISFVYAMSFAWIDRWFGRFSVKFALIHSFFLSATLLAHTALYYYNKPDWSAIHNDTATLTTLQNAVSSHFAVYGIYGGFLMLAAIRGWLPRGSGEK